MAVAVLLSLLAMWRLIRPGHVTWLPWAGEGRLRYASMGAEPPTVAVGIVLGEAGRSGIPFRRVGRGDARARRPRGIAGGPRLRDLRLRDLALQEGLDAAVWHAGPALLKVYGDLGLTALPLGQDGLLLPESKDDEPVRSDRYLCCVAERDLGTLIPQLPILARTLEPAAD